MGVTEIWLEGDHYKWRAMRANGVDERFCTGDADPYEKFPAWAATVPRCLRNPLYHWTHLELKRYFGIDELLDETTAAAIWERGQRAAAPDELTAHGILRKFDVRVVCTTDDPADRSISHARDRRVRARDARLSRRSGRTRRSTSTSPASFNPWVDRLSARRRTWTIARLADLLDALGRRAIRTSTTLGGRLSDHGLAHCYADACTDADGGGDLRQGARRARRASPEEHEQFASYLMLFFGQLDAEKGWTKQLHLGALRNDNTRGARDAQRPRHRLRLDRRLAAGRSARRLPRSARAGARAAEDDHLQPQPGRQLRVRDDDRQLPGRPDRRARSSSAAAGGSSIRRKASSGRSTRSPTAGLLSRFVGMLTDSRSFMSYPRHEYFRRVLCNLLGADVDNGELPDDDALVAA